MSTNIVGDTNEKRAAAQRPPLPKIEANFNAPVDAPPLDNPAVPPPVQPPRAADSYQPEPLASVEPASAFDPFAPVDVSGLQGGTLPLVPTAGQTPLQVQEKIVAPLEKAGIADITQSEAARLEESAQQQDISILDYNPPDIEGIVNVGNERINSLIQQLDLQDRQRKAEAQDKYKGTSLADAMMQLDKEPEQGTLQRVFKQVGDYFGGATFTDPRDGRQYTTPYVAQTQRALGLPETQKDGPPNIVGGLLYGLNAIGAAPVAFAKDSLDQVNRTVHDVTQMMPWLKGTQDAANRFIQQHAPVIAAQAIKKRDESLARTATGQRSLGVGALIGDLGRGPGTNMMTMLRGGNYSLTQEMSTGSIGKLPGTKIDVDPGSLAGFALDVATGELVERGISAIVKQGIPAVTRSAVRTATIGTLSSRAARRTRPGVRPRGGELAIRNNTVVEGELVGDPITAGPATARKAIAPATSGALARRKPSNVVQGELVEDIVTPAPPKQRALAGTPPAVKATTIPDYRAVVVRPAGRGTGKAVVPTNPDRPVMVQTIQAVPDPVVPTRAYRSAPTPSYKHPKPTGPNGQYELPLTDVVQMPVVSSLLDNTPIRAAAVDAQQLNLPGVLPERQQFGMFGVEFHPDNTVVFKGLDDMFEDGDVIAARSFFKDLAEQGRTPLVKLTADLDEIAWDNGFINALHMGFKPVADDGSFLNPNLIEFGSDVTLQLTSPGSVRKTVRPSGDEVLGTSSALLRRTDSLLGSVPSPSTRAIFETLEIARPVYSAVADVREDVSLRTMVGSLIPSVRPDGGDGVIRHRILRDVGGVNYTNNTATRQFGSVKFSVSEAYGDVYDVGFQVGDNIVRPVAGSYNVPYKDIADMSRFVIDLHKANPTARLIAEIGSSTTEEWAMKYRAYTRAGFRPVDELGAVMDDITVPPNTAVNMMFDPMRVESSVLARRLADSNVTLPRAEADPDFVELSNAVQIKEALSNLRYDADKVRNSMYEVVLDLARPSRQMIEELPRVNVGPVEGMAAVTTKYGDNYDFVYHGTRVQTTDIAQLDHINGGSPSSLGVGMHITDSALHAEYHAVKMVNADLPSNVPRDYGPPTVSRYSVNSDAQVLNADVQAPQLAEVTRQILNEIAPDIAEYVPETLSVKGAIDFVDVELEGQPELITLFQREFSDSLRESGVDIIDAGPEARVVLNPDVLYEDSLNVPLRNVDDTPMTVATYTERAFEIDYKALQTPRSWVDAAESRFMQADQRVHEIASVQEEIAQRVDNAISQTTLWDYNGVPDPDDIPRYRPDPEPELRNAATPFDTQTADISPCTL